MPTFSFTDFVPTGYLVRTESRKLLYCAELDWETGYGEQMCSTYREADAFLRNAYGNWLEVVCSEFGGKGNWIKTRDCHYGEWQIEVYAANDFHPRKFAVDGQIYVRFSPKDPAERDEWGETNHWMILDLRILMEIEAFYGLDFVADTEPEPDYEPEPEEEIFDAAMVVIERLGSKAEPEPEPEPIVIPIPTWDWVETEPEPEVWIPIQTCNWTEPDYEPEPERVTRGFLKVSLVLHDQIVTGRQAYNLPNDREEAVRYARIYSEQNRDLVTNLLGVQPETDWEIRSPDWGNPTNDWLEWVYLYSTDYYQCGIEKVICEWGFDFNSPALPDDEIESWLEPLWVGCVTVDTTYGKRSTCSAHAERSAVAEWLKGTADAYALICGRQLEEVIGRYLITEISRDNQSWRDINITIGDLVGEGIRLL